jgi:hypothetical protein
MSMFRRSRKPAPPLHRKQQEIAQKEAQLRERLESLERIITQPRPAPESKSKARAPERVPAGAPIERRFHVSIAMDTPLAFEPGGRPRRSRALRKERRQGQIVFLILLIALALAVMWLVSQLNP